MQITVSNNKAKSYELTENNVFDWNVLFVSYVILSPAVDSCTRSAYTERQDSRRGAVWEKEGVTAEAGGLGNHNGESDDHNTEHMYVKTTRNWN